MLEIYLYTITQSQLSNQFWDKIGNLTAINTNLRQLSSLGQNRESYCN